MTKAACTAMEQNCAYILISTYRALIFLFLLTVHIGLILNLCVKKLRMRYSTNNLFIIPAEYVEPQMT